MENQQRRQKTGWSLVEILVVVLMGLLVLAIAFQLFRHFSAGQTSLAAQNSFQSLCGPLVAQMKQDLRGAHAITVANDRIDLERFSGVTPGQPLATEGISYLFQPPRVIMERPEGKRVTDFSEILSLVSGTLSVTVLGRMIRDDPSGKEAVLTLTLSIAGKNRHPLPGMEFPVSITAKARERLTLSSLSAGQ